MDAARRRGAIWLFGAAAGVYLLDRASKLWAERSLPGDPLDLIPGVLSLRYTTNSGGAFSIGRSAPLLFAGATIAVSVLIVATSFRHTNRLTAIALGLVLGGALGNLTDRVVRGPGLSGRVIDFVDLHVWPIFNAADAAIVIGAVLLAMASARRPQAEESHVEAGDAGDAG